MGISGGGFYGRRDSLEIRRQLHDFLADRPHHQFCLVVNPQLPHQVEFVRIHGFNAESQKDGNRAHRPALSKQFKHLALA